MKALFFANTDWYLYNFRMEYARFLQSKGWEVCLLSPEGEHVEKLKEAGFEPLPAWQDAVGRYLKEEKL